MKKSKNYSLNLPEPDDYVIIGDLNFNTEELDRLIKLIYDNLAVLSTDGVNLKELLAKKADLGENGKIPENQLPDLDVYKDVLMYGARGNFPVTGNDRKLYVDKATGRIYRWTGSGYTEVSNALDLGETSGTAYRGDRGKIAYDHSQSPHAPADALSRAESYSREQVESKISASETTIKKIIETKEKVKHVQGKGYNAYKYGKVVTASVQVSSKNSYEVVLPAGFRPIQSMSQKTNFYSFEGGRAELQTLDIYSDGSVRAHSYLENYSMSATFTYIVAE